VSTKTKYDHAKFACNGLYLVKELSRFLCAALLDEREFEFVISAGTEPTETDPPGNRCSGDIDFHVFIRKSGNPFPSRAERLKMMGLTEEEAAQYTMLKDSPKYEL
jgi:hypothetical protein